MRLYVCLAVILSLLTAEDTRADTIVLKNGRRIDALSVEVQGDKVRYVTAAGELALPKSIVDHIEKGGLAQMPASPGAGAADLAISPPRIEASSAKASGESGAGPAGAVDRGFLASPANGARSRGAGPNEKTALPASRAEP